jgi:hypothetical protein
MCVCVCVFVCACRDGKQSLCVSVLILLSTDDMACSYVVKNSFSSQFKGFSSLNWYLADPPSLVTIMQVLITVQDFLWQDPLFRADPDAEVSNAVLRPVLWIRGILVRIRIRGSVSRTSGSGSCFFRQWLTRCQQKIGFFSRVFCLLHFEGTCTSVLNSQKKSENSWNQGYSYLLCLLMQGSG